MNNDVVQVTQARGVLVRDEAKFSSIFAVSTTGTGAQRSWPNTTQTGHYARGAFYFDSPTNQLRYFAQWIEIDGSGNREMHTRVVGIPR